MTWNKGDIAYIRGYTKIKILEIVKGTAKVEYLEESYRHTKGTIRYISSTQIWKEVKQYKHRGNSYKGVPENRKKLRDLNV